MYVLYIFHHQKYITASLPNNTLYHHMYIRGMFLYYWVWEKEMSGAFICNAFDLPFSGVMKYAKNIHVPAYRKGGGDDTWYFFTRGWWYGPWGLTQLQIKCRIHTWFNACISKPSIKIAYIVSKPYILPRRKRRISLKCTKTDNSIYFIHSEKFCLWENK